MKSIKKAIKILAFICLVILAGVGVGLSGGVPVPFSRSKRDPKKENIELIDKQNPKSSTRQGMYKL